VKTLGVVLVIVVGGALLNAAMNAAGISLLWLAVPVFAVVAWCLFIDAKQGI
jgi:hypothetical protein